MKISKTTLFGYLFLLLAAAKSVHFDAAGHLAMTPRDWFQLAIGAGGTIVGHMMQDAGTTAAKTPDGTVQDVPSHELPDNPADVPVVKS